MDRSLQEFADAEAASESILAFSDSVYLHSSPRLMSRLNCLIIEGVVFFKTPRHRGILTFCLSNDFICSCFYFPFYLK